MTQEEFNDPVAANFNKMLALADENARLREALRVAVNEAGLWRKIPMSVRASAYFPYCPERGAGLCECDQCKWAATIGVSKLHTDTNELCVAMLREVRG